MRTIKRIIVYFISFSALNLTPPGASRQAPFYALLTYTYPYSVEQKKYHIIIFALTICAYLIFISTIIQTANEQIKINNYILIRTSKTRAFLIGIFRNMKVLGCAFLCKVAADFLFAQMEGAKNLRDAVIVEVSVLLTVIIWTLLAYILFQLHIGVKWIYFGAMCLIVACQYLSAYADIFTVFVFGSPAMASSPALWLALKCCLVVILFPVNIVIANRYEQLNIKSEI